MNKFNSVVKNPYFKKFLFTAAGASVGFSYYYFIGCTSGSCPITSNPYISTIYGAVAGFILSINSKQKKAEDGTGKQAG